MAIVTRDSRLTEADRAFSHHVQRGAPPKVVEKLLPMLVGPERTQRAAEAFLAQKGYVGHDMSPEGVARERYLASEAQSLHHSAVANGLFAGTGDPVFKVPAGRYTPGEDATNAELDRQRPATGYPGSDRNADTLAVSGLEDQMRRKYDSSATVDPQSGDVFVTDPHTLVRTKVDHVNLPSRRNKPNDVSRFQRGQSGDVNLSNEEFEQAVEDEKNRTAWLQSSGSVPYFLQD